MDFLERGYLGARSYDNTFNFWNDYLGLSTLVAKNTTSNPSCSPNSITESLKATLGLEDDSPVCSCVIAHGGDADRHMDCCSIYDLSVLGPYDSQLLEKGGSFPGSDLLSMERRRKQSQRSKPEPRVCVFCRNNGAPEEVYGTHILKTAEGRVVCPILRAYTCPLCSANGDNAHTIKYCPLSKDQQSHRVKGGRALSKRLKIF